MMETKKTGGRNILKKYLTINSIFSALSGLTMMLLPNILNVFFNIGNTIVFPLIGANLLVFSALVWYVSVKQLSNKKLVMIIAILDLAWVSGSFGIVITGLFDLSKNGYYLMCIVALWIGFLAYKQFKYNK